MRCPTCSRVYDNPSLKFCYDDGTELEQPEPTFDQEASTLHIPDGKTDPQLDLTDKETVRTLAMFYQSIVAARKALTLDEVINLAPRHLSDATVVAYLSHLVNKGFIERKDDPADGQARFGFWSETSQTKQH